MIYLDHAATSLQKPESVYEAVSNTMRTCASIGRSSHTAANRAAELAFECRCAAANMFDTKPEQVVFTQNATHGLNIAIHTLVKPGNKVVISGFEHNAVLRPLVHAGAEIQIAGRILFDPYDTITAFERMITWDTAAVVCTHVSNVFGYVLPLEEIARLCKSKDVPLIVDASQSAGVLPLSLKKLEASFIAMPGHKALMGPQGTGLLLCGRLPDPLLQGGTGSLSRLAQMPDFLPDRGEAGTQNTPGIAGLLAGLQFLEQTGLETIAKKEKVLMDILVKGLSQIPDVRVFTGDDYTQISAVSFTTHKDCEWIGEQLAMKNIAVRCGLHCAPIAHESAGTLLTGTVRISPGFFNTSGELSMFLHNLSSILKS